VSRLPLPPWASYILLGLGLALVYLPFLLSMPNWVRGVLGLDVALVYSFLHGATCAYLLALMHYLDNLASAALARFRQVMSVDDVVYERLRYQLTTLPARPTLLASAVGLIYTIASIVIGAMTAGNPSPEVMSSPVLIGLTFGFTAQIYVLAAVLVYHTLHQLHMVNVIYTKHTHINVFRLGPLYALSGLTARTAIGIGIPTYIWFQVNSMSGQGATISNITQTVLFSITVVVTFIWPLVGAHNLLEKEKQHLQDSVAGRIEAAIQALNSRVDSSTGEPRPVSELQQTLDALVTEQAVIDKLRTWPWRTGTLGSVGLAFLLPIFIWLVQRLLERFGI
jgi:hypothetical protein